MAQNTMGLPGLRRALLVTLGPVAAEVAGQAAALSQAWLGVTPPLAVECLEATAAVTEDIGPCVERLADACDRLAAGELATVLAMASRPPASANEITIWLLVDVAATDAAGWPAGLLQALQELVWRRLRTHLTPAALLLAAPAHVETVHAWARRLAAVGVERMMLAGPVDANHLLWSSEAWQARAATALVALLWSEARPGTLPIEARDPQIWAVGAAAWPSPKTIIHRRIAQHHAALAGQRLLAKPPPDSESGADVPPWEVPGLAITPERHRLALEAALSPEPPAAVWPGWRGLELWSRLSGLADDLAVLARAHMAAAHDAQHTERGEWLSRQVAGWEKALLGLRTARLTPASGWPALGRYRMELAGLAAQLQVACTAIEDWLEAAGQQFATAEVAVQRARQALSATCSRFPPATRHGLLAMLFRPWRWPGWLWDALVTLPNQAQQYLNAIGRQGRARWHEANVHALRQAYLAMAQAVQESRREAEAWADALAAAAQMLTDELAQPAALPEPWQEEHLATLASGCLPADDQGEPSCPEHLSLPERGDPLPSPLAATGLPEQADAWPTADRALSGLLAWSAACLTPLDAWTAADYLSSAAEDGLLALWLARWRNQACPLWPADDAGTAAEWWLLCPPQRGDDTTSETSAAARLQALLIAPVASGDQELIPLRLAATSADAVLLLQTLAVNLKEAV